MKKASPAIIYFIVIIVVLTGLGLFLFREALLTAARQKTGVNSAAKVSDISAIVVTVASSSALDTSILKLPRFTALVNHVTNYDYDNVCWRPDAVATKVISISEVGQDNEASSTAARVNACAVGNNSPFSTVKK